MTPRPPSAAFTDPVAIAIGLVLAGVAIHTSAGLLVYRNIAGSLTLDHAIVTALLGSIVWGLLSRVPLFGEVFATIAWFAVIRYRYPGGWLRAAGHGVAAWAAAVVLIAGLELVGFGGLQAVGIPAT